MENLDTIVNNIKEKLGGTEDDNRFIDALAYLSKVNICGSGEIVVEQKKKK